MKSSKFFRCILSGVISLFVILSTNAAENGLIIPRIQGQPSLADFTGMQPNTPLASSMTKVENFIQREPYDGQASAQQTEVYIGYDQENIYTVFLAFDTNPELIRANLSSRENVFEDDRVGFMVDTFNDQISSFTFVTTPMGIQSDSRWTERVLPVEGGLIQLLTQSGIVKAN